MSSARSPVTVGHFTGPGGVEHRCHIEWRLPQVDAGVPALDLLEARRSIRTHCYAADMDRHEIARTRLLNQRIEGTCESTPEDVIAAFGAMQAQEYPYAKWGIGQRSGTKDNDVERALTEGAILRTHAMRPTWHFVAARDIRWIQELTGPRVHAVNRSIYARNELDEGVLRLARNLVERALQDGNHLTRQEIAALLRDGGIEATGQRLAYVVMHLELDAVICSGPRRGRQHTYALVQERAPHAGSMERDEALAELTRRYFARHGPATVKDFVWWSGLLMRDARRGVDMFGTDLERFELDGSIYYHAPVGETGPWAPTSVRLLQAYDEYIVGYRESRHVLDIEGAAIVPPSGRLVFWHAVTIDGQVAGYWRRSEKSRQLSVEFQPARTLDEDEYEALCAEAERFGAFFGQPAELSNQPR